MSERLLTTAQVADKLSMSRTALHYMRQRGDFPEPIRIGRACRWRESDVDGWIAERAAEVAAGGPPRPTETDGAGPAS